MVPAVSELPETLCRALEATRGLQGPQGLGLAAQLPGLVHVVRRLSGAQRPRTQNGPLVHKHPLHNQAPGAQGCHVLTGSPPELEAQPQPSLGLWAP